MAKRKLSTFERLQRGQKLSRRERKEMERRFQREDPGWDIVHENVAASMWAMKVILLPSIRS